MYVLPPYCAESYDKKYRDISCEVDVRKVNLDEKFKSKSFLFSCVVNNETDLMRPQYTSLTNRQLPHLRQNLPL